MARTTNGKTVEALKHDEAKRKNIPTAESQSVMQKNEHDPVRVAYPHGAAGLDEEKQQRNRDLDPQFVWHGKDEQNWSNRMILGDSLQVMASLAEREGLRGKVQCIYFDPPCGIKFNGNFQWSTTSRDVKDDNSAHITREPEQVKALRDTWRDGIHSYLTYLRDRLSAYPSRIDE
jgi:adenine-specific DNA-methyltransferase